MDSLTVYHLARELDERWRGGVIREGRLDRESRRLVIAAGRGAPVELDLSTPNVVARERGEVAPGGPLAGWRVESVTAPEDDRRLLIALAREGKFRGSEHKRALLEVSMLPNARAAVAHESGRTFAAIGGSLPPRATPRPTLSDRLVASAAERGDASVLTQGRWVSPMIAKWLIADPGLAAERYREICSLGAARPSRCGESIVPFPMCRNAEPRDSLLAPPADAGATQPAPPPNERRTRAIDRMRRELARASEAPRLRALADALMALGDAEAPARVRLDDGVEMEVEREPGESAVSVAERLYDDVRSMERARASLPARIDAFSRETEARRDAASARPAERSVAPHAVTRPFRTYKSSGGLEIWVGRGAESNDTLTFRESSPRDVWLHARDAAGAHVVLRWTRDEPPPSRDLEEAAVLAAWHSKSRGSALVPVDWTRRKYVRKARGGAPGLVLVSRAETVFVAPDERVERRLRDG